MYAIVIAASVHLPFWANKSSSPQYLSSSGLPIELTRTGMVNVFLVMLIAINMPFFLAMLSSTPCETALGGCNSISCVCANYLLPFGYVFMFVCILYGSLLLVRMLREMRPRSWKEMVEDGCWGCFMSAVKVILALACFGPTLTAIFPALETTYVTDPYAKEHYWGNTLHGVGVTVFPLVLILITFVWYVGHHAHKARGSAPVPFPKRGAGVGSAPSSDRPRRRCAQRTGAVEDTERVLSAPPLLRGCVGLRACSGAAVPGRHLLADAWCAKKQQ